MILELEDNQGNQAGNREHFEDQHAAQKFG